MESCQPLEIEAKEKVTKKLRDLKYAQYSLRLAQGALRQLLIDFREDSPHLTSNTHNS